MATWMKYLLGFVVPAFAFLVLKDTAGTYYSRGASNTLTYVVVEEAEEAAEVELEPTEDAKSEPDAVAEAEMTETEGTTTEADEAPAEETAADDTAAVEEAPVDDASAEDVAGAALSAEDMAAGAQAARACASCHQFERERNGVGPHLIGVIGRPVGSVDGFRYSGALSDLGADGAVWSVAEIEAWLENPSDYAPGTKMNFAVRDADERQLIANWLAAQGE